MHLAAPFFSPNPWRHSCRTRLTLSHATPYRSPRRVACHVRSSPSWPLASWLVPSHRSHPLRPRKPIRVVTQAVSATILRPPQTRISMRATLVGAPRGHFLRRFGDACAVRRWGLPVRREAQVLLRQEHRAGGARGLRRVLRGPLVRQRGRLHGEGGSRQWRTSSSRLRGYVHAEEGRMRTRLRRRLLHDLDIRLQGRSSCRRGVPHQVVRGATELLQVHRS